jgi:hypothetical protein
MKMCLEMARMSSLEVLKRRNRLNFVLSSLMLNDLPWICMDMRLFV